MSHSSSSSSQSSSHCSQSASAAQLHACGKESNWLTDALLQRSQVLKFPARGQSALPSTGCNKPRIPTAVPAATSNSGSVQHRSAIVALVTSQTPHAGTVDPRPKFLTHCDHSPSVWSSQPSGKRWPAPFYTFQSNLSLPTERRRWRRPRRRCRRDCCSNRKPVPGPARHRRGRRRGQRGGRGRAL